MSNEIRTYTLTPDAYLYHADCRDVLRALPENSIDSVCCDPPYHLTSVVKRFGGTNAKPAKYGTDGLYARQSAGFMNCQWDGGDIAFDPETWALVLRVLKPGAHLVAFGAPRGYHRMACAIEDAGFEIRDSLMNIVDPNDAVVQFMQSLSPEQLGAFLQCIDNSQFSGTLAWCFGTGFPKGRDISKEIDKMAGAKREVIGTDRNYGISRLADGKTTYGDYAGEWNITAPATEAAREWQGWNLALKPAFEPIILARKPLSEPTVAANVLKWRCGALNIDACRVPSESRPHIERRNDKSMDGAVYGSGINGSRNLGTFEQARWPANVVTDGSAEVIEAFPRSKAPGRFPKNSGGIGTESGIYGKGKGRDQVEREVDDGKGSAARFYYSAKANKTDRAGSKHPTIKPVSLMRWLTNLVTPPGGVILDPFAGSGTTGQAALENGFRVVMCEREGEYVADIVCRIAQMKKSDVAA